MPGNSMETRVEELFLRIFKWVLLAVMALSLVGALALGAMALGNWLKSDPSSASEPRSATGQIKFDDYLKSLDGDKAEPKPQEKDDAAPEVPQKGSYNRQAEAIIACTKDSLKATHPELFEQQDWDSILKREIEWLNERGDADGWGEVWANERRDFICAGAKSKPLQALIKSGKVPALQENFLHDELGNFHSKAWGKFLESEQSRISEEEATKAREALEAAAKLTGQATAAAIAFGLFMLIALYLIFAKIETNLRTPRGD